MEIGLIALLTIPVFLGRLVFVYLLGCVVAWRLDTKLINKHKLTPDQSWDEVDSTLRLITTIMSWIGVVAILLLMSPLGIGAKRLTSLKK